MDISVVVPTFNRREVVARTLANLFSQSFPSDRYEIIVVVDGSTDGTAEALKHLSATCEFRVIEQENRGLAGARNTGYRAARSGLVLFLDDDMICDQGLIAAHVAGHARSARTVGFGAIFLTADSPPSLAAECFKLEIGALHLEHLKTHNAQWTESACVFGNTSISSQLLNEAGGFDENFRMREDLELGVRLRNLGMKPAYISDAVAYQYYAKTASDLLGDAERFAVADQMFAKKHPDVHVAGYLTAAAKDAGWRDWVRARLASSTLLERLILAPACWAGEALIQVPLARKLGVRALRARRRVRWLRTVRRLRALDNDARKGG